MSAIPHEPVTPSRKRAASEADRRPQRLPIPNYHSESQKTPDAGKVPDLSWDDVSEPGESFVETPFDNRIPLETRSKKSDILLTSSKPISELRRSRRIKALKSSKSLEKESFEDPFTDPVPKSNQHHRSFAPIFYPAVPKLEHRDSAVSIVVKADIDPKNFNFTILSKKSEVRVTHSSGSTKVSSLAVSFAYPNQRSSTPKKIKQDQSRLGPTVDDYLSTRDTNLFSLPYSSPTQDIVDFDLRPGREATQLKSAARQSGSVKRFTRILPFNALKRLLEKPDRCVATLVSRPDERCSMSTKPPKENGLWLQNYLSEPKLSENIITLESCLRELIHLSTCTKYHRSIAIKQLDALLDHVDKSHPHNDQVKQGRHSFIDKDLEVLPAWLEALTNLSDGNKTSSRTPLSTTDTSLKDLDPEKLDKAESISHNVLEQTVLKVEVCQSIIQDDGNGANSSTTTMSRSVTPAVTSALDDLAEPLQASEISNNVPVMNAREIPATEGASEVKQEYSPERVANPDNSPPPKENQQFGNAHPKETAQSEETKTIKIEEIVERLEVLQTEITNTIIATKATREIQVSQDANADSELLENRKTTTTTTEAHAPPGDSPFDPSQPIKIRFWTAPTFAYTQDRQTHMPQPLLPSEQQYLLGLCQRFEPYQTRKSLRFEPGDWIRERFHEPLRQQEMDMTPDRKTGLAKHIGLIYMYWITGSFGFVKIGKTSGPSTKARLNAWRKSCGHAIEEHTRGEEETAVQLPHVYRLERLIHAELNEFRVREVACPMCSKEKQRKTGICASTVDHVEWFRVSPAHAKRVIDKWSNWMLKRPYELCRGGVWQLKASVTDFEIAELCTPLAVASGVPGSGPGVRQRRGRPELMARRATGRRGSKEPRR